MWIKKRKKSGSKAAYCMIPDIRHPEKTELDRKSAGLREGGMDRTQTRAPGSQLLACSRTVLITSHRVCTKQTGVCWEGSFSLTVLISLISPLTWHPRGGLQSGRARAVTIPGCAVCLENGEHADVLSFVFPAIGVF